MRREVVITIFLVAVGATLGVASTQIKYSPFQPLPESVLFPFSSSRSLESTKWRPIKHTDYMVYGFLPYWTLSQAKYLQLDKLTDIAYFGLHISEEGGFQKVNADGELVPGYNNWRNSKTLTRLIEQSDTYAIRFALTIVSHDDEISTTFLNCDSCWVTLKDDLISELKYRGIQDVNLNFEYGEYVEPELAHKYSLLTEYLNSELDAEFGDSYVVVSTFADSLISPRVTNIPELSQVADAMFIMGYDFHRPTSSHAGPVAPVAGVEGHKYYDLKTMASDYLTYASPDKLILGVPYYGYNWVVESEETRLNRLSKSEAAGHESAGDYEVNGDDDDDDGNGDGDDDKKKVYVNNDPRSERIPGDEDIGYSKSQTYEQILATIQEIEEETGEEVEVLWDDLGKVPYFNYVSLETGSDRKVYFENRESLRHKYQLAKEHNFGGIGIWALGYDGERTEFWDLIEEELMGF